MKKTQSQIWRLRRLQALLLLVGLGDLDRAPDRGRDPAAGVIPKVVQVLPQAAPAVARAVVAGAGAEVTVRFMVAKCGGIRLFVKSIKMGAQVSLAKDTVKFGAGVGIDSVPLPTPILLRRLAYAGSTLVYNGDLWAGPYQNNLRFSTQPRKIYSALLHCVGWFPRLLHQRPLSFIEQRT